MASSRLDKMKHAVAKGMWKRLENLMRPEERALFLAIFDSGSYACSHIPCADLERIERVLIVIGLLGAPENPAELAELTDKGRIFARYTDPMYKEIAGMEDRINLLKSLADKQDWEALYKTLYTNERETLRWISDPETYGPPLPTFALDECIATLIQCGLAISGAGPVSLTLDGERLLNYLGRSMGSTNVAHDYPVKPSSEKADEGSEPVSGGDQPVQVDCLEEAGKIVRGSREDTYGPAERNLSRIAEMWSAYLSMPLTARQVAVMMVLLKASRDAFKPKHDNMVDICGYAYLADMIDNDTAIK